MNSLRIFALVLIFTLLFIVEPAQAQSGVDLLSGSRPFGSYQSGEVDSIDLSNGKPIIEIPLISYPQRGGKLQEAFVLRYHNTGQILGGMSGCIPSVFGGGCIVFPYDSGFETPIQKGLVTANYGCTHDIGSYTCAASVMDADGSHPMAAINSTTFRAADGTGYLLELPSSYPVLLTNPTINYTHTITDAKGLGILRILI